MPVIIEVIDSLLSYDNCIIVLVIIITFGKLTPTLNTVALIIHHIWFKKDHE